MPTTKIKETTVYLCNTTDNHEHYSERDAIQCEKFSKEKELHNFSLDKIEVIDHYLNVTIVEMFYKIRLFFKDLLNSNSDFNLETYLTLIPRTSSHTFSFDITINPKYIESLLNNEYWGRKIYDELSPYSEENVKDMKSKIQEALYGYYGEKCGDKPLFQAFKFKE